MHAVAAFFAGIIAFVSGLFAPTVASNSPVNVQTTQPAAAAATQTEITGDPFNDPTAASVVAAALAAAPSPAFSPPQAQTVINQPVIERIIERIVPQGAGSISTETLAAILSDFEQSISNRIAALNPPKATIPEQVAAAGNATGAFFPASQRIDQLTNTAINTPTITGGAISGASAVGASSGSFGALSAGTLNLSGALSGTDATFSGTLTAGTLNVAGVSSGGAITGPYFTATSTTATSSFAGAFTAASSAFNILQNGNVGIGTANPSYGLDVKGFINTDGTAGGYKLAGNTVLYASTTNNTLAVGASAAAAWMSASSSVQWQSVAVGSGALATTPTSGAALYNTAVGYNALNHNTTGTLNTATGLQALNANTTGTHNTAHGVNALYSNTSGTVNAATGMNALFSNTTGSNNTALGSGALKNNRSATNTVAVGMNAAEGAGAAYSNQGGSYLGYLAGYSARTGSDFNTLLGYQAGYGITTGSNNIWIGTATSSTGIANLTTGSQNILIGNNISLPSATASGQLNIGNIIYGTGITGTGSTVSSGNIGIGTTTPGTKLYVANTSGSSYLTLDSGGASSEPGVLFKQDSSSKWALGTTFSSSGSDFYLYNYNTASTVLTGDHATGYVGIGTTTPWGKLSITGSGTGTGLAFAVADSTNTPRFVIQDNGNIGIGTTTPSVPFHVVSTSIPQARIAYDSSNYTDVRYDGFNTVGGAQTFLNAGSEKMRISSAGNVGIGTTSPAAKLEVSSSGSGNPVSFYMDGDRGLLNAQAGNIGFRNKSTNIASIDGYTGATGGSINYGQLVFSTANSGSLIERMRITESGNVGIGTTTPQQKLAVSSSGDTRLVIDSSGAGSQSILSFQNQGVAKFEIKNQPSGGGQFLSVGRYGANDLNVDNNGNVGIGTTTPQAKLSVSNTTGGSALDLDFSSSVYGIRFQRNGQDMGSIYKNVSGPLNFSSYATQGTTAGFSFMGGNVGIGTTTPGSILHLESSLPILSLNTNTSGNSARINFRSNNALTSVITADFTDNSLQFFNNGATRLYIGNTGNVGIGTTTPGGILEVGNTSSSGIIANFTNGNSAATAYTELGVRNGYTVGNNADALRLLTFSTGWTTTGGFVQDGAALEAGVNLSGGLSMVARNSAGVLRFYTGGQADSNERMRITSTGNVGIGTTSLSARMTISTSNSEVAAFNSDSVNGGYIDWNNGGSTIGFAGAALPLAEAGFSASDFSIRARNNLLFISNGGISNRYMMWTNAGNLGIGTTSPTAQLSTTGTVRFSNFGAGTLTTDASGNLSVSSDERLKNIDGEFTRGLADIVKLTPISYHWNDISGLDKSTQYAGFSAQNVQTAIPEAVGSSTNGYLTLQDRPLIAALVNAIKELAQQFGGLTERITTRELIAVNGNFQHVQAADIDAHTLCLDGVCVTKDQLAALLAAAGQTTVSPSPAMPASAPQAPVIEISGNATSTIEFGAAYLDLGARIIAPADDLNLGIVIILDGATTTAVSIDTTQPGEHTILYTVTSPTSGLTGSAMRTVIVSPATQSSEPPANDNVSTSNLLNSEPAAVSL